MPCHLTVRLRGGKVVESERDGYEGFFTRPMSWESVVRKFKRLSGVYVDAGLRHAIVSAVEDLEQVAVQDLAGLLERIPAPKGAR
jgi:2-methylcitrate dehydratase